MKGSGGWEGARTRRASGGTQESGRPKGGLESKRVGVGGRERGHGGVADRGRSGGATRHGERDTVVAQQVSTGGGNEHRPGEAQIREALNAARRSPFSVFERELPLSWPRGGRSR